MDAIAEAEWYDPEHYDRLARDLKSAGWSLIEFDGAENVSSLFQEFKTKLPLDPPISGRVNWDAFADSFWLGLNDLDAEAIALIWRGAGYLARSDPRSFDVAQDVLLTTAGQLSAGQYGARPGRKIRVFFEHPRSGPAARVP